MFKKLLGNFNIKRKLIITYFLIVFFPMLFLGMFFFENFSTSIKTKVSEYAYDLLKQINENIDNSIIEIDRIPLIISSNYDIISILKKNFQRSPREKSADMQIINKTISETLRFRSNYDGLYIFSVKGDIYEFSVLNSYPINYDYENSPWHVKMINENKENVLLATHFQTNMIGQGKPSKVFSVASSINDFSKQLVGYVLLDVNPRIFYKTWSKLSNKQYKDFIVIDADKTIVYHNDFNLIAEQLHNEYVDAVLENKNGYMIYPIEGEDSLITYNTSNYTGWTIISIIPLSILYTEVYNAQILFYTITLLCILISLFVAILLSNSITKPIQKLKQIMLTVESGDFNISFPVTTHDEIGQLGTGFNKMILKIKELFRTVYQIQILKKEAELNALQSQINPHFLYNTLQIMDSIGEKQGVFEICKMCQSLSDIFRYSINRGKEVVPLRKEIEHLKNYIYIQKTRYKDKVNFKYQIKKELWEYKVLKLTLQPLVENALLHGIKDKININISAYLENSLLKIVIEDNGVGIESNKLQLLKKSLSKDIIHAEINDFSNNINKDSIGLTNVNSRIILYFGKDYGLTIESDVNHGTKVIVTLPAMQEYQ